MICKKSCITEKFFIVKSPEYPKVNQWWSSYINYGKSKVVGRKRGKKEEWLYKLQ